MCDTSCFYRKVVKIEVYFGVASLEEIFFSEMFEHVEKLPDDSWKLKKNENGYCVVAEVTEEKYMKLCKLAEILGCVVKKILSD